MMNTPIKIARQEKRLRTDNATIEIPEHFLDCLLGNGTNCYQKVKDRIESDCLKVTENIHVNDLEACKSSKKAGDSAIEQDGVQKRSPRSKENKGRRSLSLNVSVFRFEAICIGIKL